MSLSFGYFNYSLMSIAVTANVYILFDSLFQTSTASLDPIVFLKADKKTLLLSVNDKISTIGL